LGLLLALNIDLEIVFGLLLLISIALSVIVIVRKNLRLKSIMAFVLGALLIFAPRIVFEFRHQFLMTKAFLNLLTKGTGEHVGLSLNVLINRFLVMFDQFSSSLTNSNKLFGALILLFISLSLVVLYRKTDTKIRNFITTSVIVTFIFLLGTVVFSHDIWPHYLVGLPVFYILLLGIAFYLLRKQLANAVFVSLLIFLLFLINLNPQAVVQGLTQPLWEGDASVYRNQLTVIDYVYKQAAGKNFKYVVYTPPVYDYTYQYLFSWYGPQKYHYSPLVQSNLAFFILEPDLQYPFRLSDWLKQREADGRIIRSQEVKGGIIVQTRIH
jgi:hypothetical protein